MKGFFWNCNGFADSKKYRFLSDLTNKKGLDFIVLSETKLVEPTFLTTLLIPFVLVETSFGIVWLRQVDVVACW
jgi:hypothetical protein